MKKYDFLKQLTGDRYYHMEGYLFPDTYDFFKDEAPEDAISKLVNNCDRKLTEEIREEIAASGMTIDQVMTLASMIQAEAADEEDMYMISSVFHNRLNSDGLNGLLRLQSDPHHVLSVPYEECDSRGHSGNVFQQVQHV
ncbi:endolytic transglycosylase MltG [Anaeromassilibacillus sp. SJQ-1]|uniref:endolytic transglycosylase MltG n=1 Tax=Anaeromassilibacillus sp. SJQ-1 TaxID=3375419 RepID=UPI003989F17E